MRILKNTCLSLGLLVLVASVVFPVLWLFLNLNKIGVTALSFLISCVINWMR